MGNADGGDGNVTIVLLKKGTNYVVQYNENMTGLCKLSIGEVNERKYG